jgi:hypothetical protein
MARLMTRTALLYRRERVRKMKVRALRTDSWMGIKQGEIYNTKVVNGKIIVETNGYIVLFSEKDFALENGGSIGTVFV